MEEDTAVMAGAGEAITIKTRTKIICTIGPAVSSYEMILKLIDAGMDVARLNFSHGTQEEHLQVINNLKKARAEKKVPLAIMLDTKGPEIRVGKLEGDQVELKAGQKILAGKGGAISITPPIVLGSLKVGEAVLFDDGCIISKVVEKTNEGVLLEIQNNGILKSHKGVNIPNSRTPLPAMTEQDVKDIIFGCTHDVDLVAASFIRSADHVMEIKKLLNKQNKPDILVIAKIENSEGVDHFDNIIEVADGIMVARGDLGVELPLKRVPHLQKMMIRKCYTACKPVIVATQMLESMIHNPRPTRAEVSDVANAIYDSTSCVMLSGETAVGKYPIETLKMMKSIIEETEKDFDYRNFFDHTARQNAHDVSSSVALSSVNVAYTIKCKAIFAFTNSGHTARLISRYRPSMPIVALTANPKVYHQMAINWGVIPVDTFHATNAEEAFSQISAFALRHNLVHPDDHVVVTSGSPFGIRGTTNNMTIRTI